MIIFDHTVEKIRSRIENLSQMKEFLTVNVFFIL